MNDDRSQDAQSWKQLYRAAALETEIELVPLRVEEARIVLIIKGAT
jgi:hypothetical protein